MLLLAPETVAELACRDEANGQREQVGVDNPLQFAERGIEICLDRRVGDVHDGGVEPDHE
jgi:hypothetical protein